MEDTLFPAIDLNHPREFKIYFDKIPSHLHGFLKFLASQKLMWLNPFLCRINSVEIGEMDGGSPSLAWSAIEETFSLRELQHELSRGKKRVSIDVCFSFFF
jgi:hypothetical protein